MCVRAAYSPYIRRIGQTPGPMLDDYDRVIREHHAYVIEEGGEVVGALVLIEKDGGLLLDNVAVLPSRHGEGVGRRLLEHAESEACRLGYADLDLYTHQGMTENVALYTRIGYVEVDRRIEHGFPRVYMRKRLRPISANARNLSLPIPLDASDARLDRTQPARQNPTTSTKREDA